MGERYFNVPEGRRLCRAFFERDGITLAKELLGKVLVHNTALGPVRGVITETESYMGEEDKGSHAYGGRRTERTEPMYHRGGTSYVYLIYGMYNCMNIAAMGEGIPQAVLLRAAVPADEESGRLMEKLRFMELQKRRHRQERAKEPEENLCATGNTDAGKLPVPVSVKKHLADGPGRLCIAMDIKRADNDIDMVTSPSFYVTEGITVEPPQIKAGRRIGIEYAQEAAEYLWRFYL